MKIPREIPVGTSGEIPLALMLTEGALTASFSPVNTIVRDRPETFSKTPFGATVTVNENQGIMYGVSLLQVGEAKGHGLWIDAKSLETAKSSLEGKTLAAHITHEGAHQSDRMLLQIGFFETFYIEDGKLKAKEFKALQSFKEDEPERYNRLFDLATEMPDSFGLSLVFEADLVYVLEDGSEELIIDSKGENAIREMPSVRFKDVTSADFVDAPAANRDGLFSEKHITKKKMEDSNSSELAEEEVVEEATPQEPEQENKEEGTKDEPSEPEATEEVSEEEEAEAEAELSVEELSKQVKALNERIDDLEGKLSDKEKENELLSEALSGSEPVTQSLPDTKTEKECVSTFMTKDGQDSVLYFQEHKDNLLKQYNTLRGDK